MDELESVVKTVVLFVVLTMTAAVFGLGFLLGATFT